MPKLRAPIAAWLDREIAVTKFLSGQDAPVVTPSGELPPGPHEHDGFAISFWTYVRPDPDRTPTADDCSAMLGDLHAALRSYPGDLPMLGDNDIARGLEALDLAGGVLSEGDVDQLRAAAERLSPLWESPSVEVQPLHGDAHPGNLIAARGGGLVWIDFEDVCLGPVEWDLATMMDPGVVAAHHRPDPVVLARCTELRALQVALALISFHDDFGDMEGWDEGIRSMVEMLASSE